MWKTGRVSLGDSTLTTIRPAPSGAATAPRCAAPAGRLAELEPSPAEECGVFGVWAPGEEVSRLTYFGLYALQHRGQEAAGIASTEGSHILVYKDLGLVSQVFDDRTLSSLTGYLAVGHVRYATTGATTWENAQPMLGPVAGSTLALTHNGNLTNTRELMEAVRATSGEDLTGELGRGSSTDTAVIAALMNLVSEHGRLAARDGSAVIPGTGGPAADPDADLYLDDPDDPGAHPLGAARSAPLTVSQAARRVLPMLRGAFSLVFMDEHTLYAARDPHGVRPLVLGRLERGWVVASETAALDIVGASPVREIEPGEMIEIDADGVRTTRFARPRRSGCVFEYVYLARPDTKIAGRSIIASRNAMGAALAREHGVAGFMYYYYWFSGERLLHLPLEMLHASDTDQPFCIMWANENWTRRWDGRASDVLIGQDYSKVPAEDFIDDVMEFLLDPRYMRIDGKAVLAVYRPGQMKNFADVVRTWRERAREAGAGDLYVLAVAVADEFDSIGTLGEDTGIDGTLQFPPHNLPWVAGPATEVVLDHRWRGNFMSYQETVKASLALSGSLKDNEYPGAMVGFDNTARRQWTADTWYGSNPYTFRRWVAGLVDSVMPRDPEHRVVFINAWNEWAESAVLEPTTRFGRTFLLALRDVVWQ